MSIFTNEDKKLLMNLFRMNQNEVHIFLAKLLKTQYSKGDLDINKDYIFVHGKDPILFVAHMDTVYDHRMSTTDDFKKRPIIFDEEKQLFWSPDGLGADDRAGIFMILKLLSEGHCPNILFTRDEEIGGKSAMLFAYDYKETLHHCNIKYIVQLDRRGSNDCVFYSCDNPKFTKYISSFGFTPAIGLFTDISIICPETGIAGVNLSVGYYNEHTMYECLSILETLKNYDIIIKMIQNSKNLKKPFVYMPQRHKKRKDKKGKMITCECCLEQVKETTYVEYFGYICDVCKSFLQV